jgi:Zn-dependent protease with chaperone function
MRERIRQSIHLARVLTIRYFYGLPWSKHIVIYDTLIEQSTPSEVEAVLGHELGHWYFCKSPMIKEARLFC